ncbi:MAG: hypothetical protein RQ741_07620 [Wenzhouxiangellaceae bacterium]|nr:hypothetical protein [Wenzhouxiangellaceae bacterium]
METLILATTAALALNLASAEADPSRPGLMAAERGQVTVRHESRSHAPARSQNRQRLQPERHAGRARANRSHRDPRHEQAHEYAATAVRQAREIRSLGYNPDHPRWSTKHRGHYRWALHANPDQMHRETRKRANKLRELRRYQYESRPYRRGY